MENYIKKYQKSGAVSYDKDSDILYLGYQKDDEEEFIEVVPGVNIELNKDKKVIGVEILGASSVLKPFIGGLYEGSSVLADLE